MFAAENCTENSAAAVGETAQDASVCVENKEEVLPETLFDYTNATAELKIINGIKVYVINQNDDTRYNMGYALGKSVIINNPDYAKDLREFIDAFIKEQSEYMLEDVSEKISSAMPCWVKDEMAGFASAININNTETKITLKDIIMLNTLVLWTKLPKEPPQAPPAAPTSVTPIKHKYQLQSDLSPVSEIVDQTSLFMFLNSQYVKEGIPMATRTYSRRYSGFFDDSPAIMLYNLTNSSFINIGFEGLLTVFSAMNENGVLINAIQSPDQKNIKVIGATPPTVNTRIAIESSRTAKECKTILENQKSSLEEIFTIVDKENHYVVGTTIENIQVSNFKEYVAPNRIVIYNFELSDLPPVIAQKIKNIENGTIETSLADILAGLQRNFIQRTKTTDNTNRRQPVFRAIFNIDEKKIFVLMPKLDDPSMDNNYAILDFESFKPENELKIEEQDTQELYREMFNE